MTNINGYCPACKADLDGRNVLEDFMKISGYTREEALASAKHYAGWEEHGENNRWGRAIGQYSIEHDRTISWRCPDCNHEWKR